MSRCLRNCARDNLRGQKSLGPLKMSLEMAHKVIVPPKKNYIPQFLKQRDINSYSFFLQMRSCVSVHSPFIHKLPAISDPLIHEIPILSALLISGAVLLPSSALRQSL
jgi:hypothetical protein